MALVEMIGNRYRMRIGMSDHNEIWQMMPEGWSPGGGDTIMSDVMAAPEPPPAEALGPEPAPAKKTKR